jgi:hypothetical protein
MKMKLNKLVGCKDYTLNIDEYVPLNIEFNSMCSHPLYWRGGNGLTSLIEIGIDRVSGELKSITLCQQFPLEILTQTSL